MASASVPPAGSPPGAVTVPLTLERLRTELGDTTLRQHLATIRASIANGESDETIAEEQSWPIEAVEVLRKAVRDAEIVSMGRPTNEVFADYVLRQEGCIRDLNDAIERFGKEPKTAHVVVGAVKAKSEILDRVMMRGQEFGVLQKAPQRREILKGEFIAELPPHKMRELVRQELGALNRLQRLVGDAGTENKDSGRVISIETDGGNGDRIDQTERRRRIAGRGADRAKGARVKLRRNLVRRSKATAPPE